MCPLRTKTIWNNPQHFTLLSPIQVIFYLRSHSQPLASNMILATCIIKLYFFPILLICPINITSFYFTMTKGKLPPNFHTKHIGINDWICINFKHIGYKYVRWQQNLGNVQEMTLGYFPSNICWKLERGEHNGKKQFTKHMNRRLGNGWIQR